MRKEILAIRRQMLQKQIALLSSKMRQQLLNWDIYAAARVIMAFLAMPDEPQMDEVITQAIADNKKICVPYCAEADLGIMAAVQLTGLADLVIGKHNIRTPEPKNLTVINPSELDLIIVPGVAFDSQGKRLGMGAGYYDRFLPKAEKAALIGAAWPDAVLPEVPAEEHDFTVDYLLTPVGIIKCNKVKCS